MRLIVDRIPHTEHTFRKLQTLLQCNLIYSGYFDYSQCPVTKVFLHRASQSDQTDHRHNT